MTHRQLDLAATQVRDINAILVAMNDTADISDVMGETAQNEVRVVGGRRGALQLPSCQDVVPNQRHEHGMFDVVIERIAVSDALQRQPGGKRQQIRQSGMRRAEPAFDFLRQVRAKGLRGQLRDCDHLGTRSR